MQSIRADNLIAALLFAASTLYAPPSAALQPLEAFVAGARRQNPDALEATANLSQQQAQADSSLGAVLPGVSARGSYTRNQYSSTIDVGLPKPVTIVPTHQWDGTASPRVPLIDLPGSARAPAPRT